jgi:hypothetical protein
MDRRQMKSRFNREIVPVSVNVSACWSKTTAASRENIRNRLDGRGNGTPNGVEKHSRPLLFSGPLSGSLVWLVEPDQPKAGRQTGSLLRYIAVLMGKLTFSG